MQPLLGVTPITSLNQVDFVGNNSPLNVTFSADGNTTQVELSIWVWSGPIGTPMSYTTSPTFTLISPRVSQEDNYITFQVSDLIRGFIKPTIEFGTTMSAPANEIVYWTYTAQETKTVGGPINYLVATRAATLGYNWNYEGQIPFTYNRGSFGFNDADVPIYQDGNITYYNPIINLDNATNTDNLILRTVDIPTYLDMICVRETWTIVYLSKQGTFNYFTPSGKVTVNVEIERDDYQRSYRNPKTISTTQARSTQQYNIRPKQSYTMNTGMLREEMGQLVEEIKYSPMVYIIAYQPITSTHSFTADNTEVTADSTLIFGSYTSYRQIPVVCIDKDFGRKTRINDKNKISYEMKFEEANFKINNIR